MKGVEGKSLILFNKASQFRRLLKRRKLLGERLESTEQALSFFRTYGSLDKSMKALSKGFGFVDLERILYVGRSGTISN